MPTDSRVSNARQKRTVVITEQKCDAGDTQYAMYPVDVEKIPAAIALLRTRQGTLSLAPGDFKRGACIGGGGVPSGIVSLVRKPQRTLIRINTYIVDLE
jgi:hypothetical protein